MARVNHTIAQMLAMLVDERQNDWDAQFPHVEFAYNNSVSAATGLVPNEVHMGRLPRLPRTIFDRSGVADHQNLARNHLAYCDLNANSAPTISFARCMPLQFPVWNGNSALPDALRQAPDFVVSNLVWLHNTASTIRQGAKDGTAAKVLKTKIALNWTGPYIILALGPCPFSDTPDGSPLGDKLLYSDLPTDMPSAHAHRRDSVERCKPCTTPHDRGDVSKCHPDGLTQYVLNNFTKKSPPYHVT